MTCLWKQRVHGVREWKRRQRGAPDSYLHLSVLHIRSSLSPMGPESILRLQINSTQHTLLTSHPRYLQHQIHTHIRMCRSWQIVFWCNINYRCVTNFRKKTNQKQPNKLWFSYTVSMGVGGIYFYLLVLQLFRRSTLVDISTLVGAVSSSKTPPTFSEYKTSLNGLARIKKHNVKHTLWPSRSTDLSLMEQVGDIWRTVRWTIFPKRKLSCHQFIPGDR